MNIAVSGSHGFIGSALVPALRAAGHQVVRLIRDNDPDDKDGLRWNTVTGMIDRRHFEGIEAVIHLAGAGVAERWTPARKALIRDSRVLGTRQLVEMISGLSRRPRHFLCASAIGIYGNRGDIPLTENAPPGVGFLADVCSEWESATELATTAGLRVATLRFGVVLDRRGGALANMLPAFRWGVGGPMGHGRQIVSWISLEDTVRAIEWVLNDNTLQGPVNIVAPEPVSQRDFARAVGRAVSRPAVLPLPAFMVNLLLGEMGRELLLSGARIQPGKLTAAGFTFHHPTLESALYSALRKEI